MLQYRISEPGNEEFDIVFRNTEKEARDEMRKTPEAYRAAILVELIDVPTDKASVNAYLNWKRPEGLPALKSWRGTARGGLKEVGSE